MIESIFIVNNATQINHNDNIFLRVLMDQENQAAETSRSP